MSVKVKSIDLTTHLNAIAEQIKDLTIVQKQDIIDQLQTDLNKEKNKTEPTSYGGRRNRKGNRKTGRKSRRGCKSRRRR